MKFKRKSEKQQKNKKINIFIINQKSDFFSDNLKTKENICNKNKQKIANGCKKEKEINKIIEIP